MSWRLEALLLAIGPDGREVPIARTRSREALRRLRDVVMGEARADARTLRRLDPLLGRIGSAEARRLAQVLRIIDDPTVPPSELRLVSPGGRK